MCVCFQHSRHQGINRCNIRMNIYFTLVGLLCIVFSMSVCLLTYLRSHTSTFHRLFVHVACGHGSFLFWWQCNTLHTSSFMDYVILYIKNRMCLCMYFFVFYARPQVWVDLHKIWHVLSFTLRMVMGESLEGLASAAWARGQALCVPSIHCCKSVVSSVGKFGTSRPSAVGEWM